MDIDFIGEKKVSLTMPHHIDEALEYFGENLKGNVVNTETSRMFTITDEARELGDKKKECYHSITANILLVVKVSQSDLEIALSFLCNRFQFPTEEYWSKLKRALNYLKLKKMTGG